MPSARISLNGVAITAAVALLGWCLAGVAGHSERLVKIESSHADDERQDIEIRKLRDALQSVTMLLVQQHRGGVPHPVDSRASWMTAAPMAAPNMGSYSDMLGMSSVSPFMLPEPSEEDLDAAALDAVQQDLNSLLEAYGLDLPEAR